MANSFIYNYLKRDAVKSASAKVLQKARADMAKRGESQKIIRKLIRGALTRMVKR